MSSGRPLRRLANAEELGELGATLEAEQRAGPRPLPFDVVRAKHGAVRAQAVSTAEFGARLKAAMAREAALGERGQGVGRRTLESGPVLPANPASIASPVADERPKATPRLDQGSLMSLFKR